MTSLPKIDILAIGVHPDDVELCASGTLLRHAAQGKTFGILDLTRGELGTRGTAEVRLQEAANAARLLGAAFRETLDLPDGLFTYSPGNWLKIVRVIRACRPGIVLCNAPEDRHPDHGRSAKLETDACFYAGLEKIETFDDNGIKQEKWRPHAVYHYIQDVHLTADFVVDITPYVQRKMESIMAFRSQFYDPGSDAPDTPISGKDFLEYMEARMKVYGRSVQAPYAEGFICARTPGVNDLFDLV
ncbi:MAG: bacillithiol biosynthesis deacetylase BshB1 [Haliscomenobacteraceae bacterium CHB4]|nr:N-acetyl-alpha-D-glucosaminyl L-malate deacetylase 1 [Saprospiraceae bacterium]MCE7922870.1 bacillithiol biosynthesis deacetylase BshB1 [Haliscomenobacteraceae bacterium CHB4]